MSEPFFMGRARTHARAKSRSLVIAPRETTICVCVCVCVGVRVCGSMGGCVGARDERRDTRTAAQINPRSEENKIRRGNGIMLLFGAKYLPGAR